MNLGHDLSTLFLLDGGKSRRESSYDRTGGNHDWYDFEPGETRTFAEISGPAVIRHIWMTHWTGDENWQEEPMALRKIVLRIYWDDETTPSVECPLGDFFGLGNGKRVNYVSAAFAAHPQDGRGMNCFFPMPFRRKAVFTLENACLNHTNFYFYIDYEQYPELPDDAGYFHAQWRRERDTRGWAPRKAGLLDEEKANVPEEPAWVPKAWLTKNLTGQDNYVILEARGRGKFVGANLTINVTPPQANDWYGEGDDMFFIDGEPWPPRLHGTGTEDYFLTAFGPAQTYSGPYSGLTVYSGSSQRPHEKYAGQNSMYRLHILDPINFERELLFSIEHGHANKLSLDYSSTAYWYQAEPHAPFPRLPDLEDRL